MFLSDGGGGSISVDPAVLSAMASRVAAVASDTSSARGSFGGAAGAAAGCHEPAAGSFAHLQSLLAGALACLDDCSQALSKAIASGSDAYVYTDATQVPMTIQGCPAAP